MRRETRGIFTDVASIIVGDPCKIMGREDWHKLVDQRWQSHLDPDSDPRSPLSLPDHGGIIVPTVENCDGWTRADIYYNKDGWPTRIVVNLSSKVEKPGEKK